MQQSDAVLKTLPGFLGDFHAVDVHNLHDVTAHFLVSFGSFAYATVAGVPKSCSDFL